MGQLLRRILCELFAQWPCVSGAAFDGKSPGETCWEHVACGHWKTSVLEHQQSQGESTFLLFAFICPMSYLSLLDTLGISPCTQIFRYDLKRLMPSFSVYFVPPHEYLNPRISLDQRKAPQLRIFGSAVGWIFLNRVRPVYTQTLGGCHHFLHVLWKSKTTHVSYEKTHTDTPILPHDTGYVVSQEITRYQPLLRIEEIVHRQTDAWNPPKKRMNHDEPWTN